MRIHTAALIAIAAAVLPIVGCAAATRPYSMPAPLQAYSNTTAYTAGYDVVWQAALSTVIERGLHVELAQKESGMITTKPEYLWDGYGAGSVLKGIGYAPECNTCDWRTARYSLVVYVNSQGEGGTRVRVKPTIEGFSGLWGWKEWETAGVLERELLEAIQARL